MQTIDEEGQLFMSGNIHATDKIFKKLKNKNKGDFA